MMYLIDVLAMMMPDHVLTTKTMTTRMTLGLLEEIENPTEEEKQRIEKLKQENEILTKLIQRKLENIEIK